MMHIALFTKMARWLVGAKTHTEGWGGLAQPIGEFLTINHQAQTNSFSSKKSATISTE